MCEKKKNALLTCFPRSRWKTWSIHENWTWALILSFCCLKYFVILKALKTRLGILLFPLYFYLYYMIEQSQSGSVVKVMCLKPTFFSSKESLLWMKRFNQKPDGNYKQSVQMQLEKKYCKLDFLLQTHLLLPCIYILKYWQHKIITL